MLEQVEIRDRRARSVCRQLPRPGDPERSGRLGRLLERLKARRRLIADSFASQGGHSGDSGLHRPQVPEGRNRSSWADVAIAHPSPTHHRCISKSSWKPTSLEVTGYRQHPQKDAIWVATLRSPT